MTRRPGSASLAPTAAGQPPPEGAAAVGQPGRPGAARRSPTAAGAPRSAPRRPPGRVARRPPRRPGRRRPGSPAPRRPPVRRGRGPRGGRRRPRRPRAPGAPAPRAAPGRGAPAGRRARGAGSPTSATAGSCTLPTSRGSTSRCTSAASGGRGSPGPGPKSRNTGMPIARTTSWPSSSGPISAAKAGSGPRQRGWSVGSGTVAASGSPRIGAPSRSASVPERRPGPRVGDAVPGQHDGSARARQQRGRAVERLGVRRARRPAARTGTCGGGAGPTWTSTGRLSTTGPARRRQGGRAGLGQQPRQVLRPPRLPRALGERPRHPHDVPAQERVARQHRLLLLADRHEEWHTAPGGVEDARHRVGQAGLHVDVDRRRAARGLGVAVGHPHGGGLVQRQHVAHPVLAPEGVRQGQLGGARGCRRGPPSPARPGPRAASRPRSRRSPPAQARGAMVRPASLSCSQ